MTNHEPTKPRPGSLMDRVAKAMVERDVSPKSAALAIGVGVSTLQNHLLGEHVRSDSARKYENWLAGRRDAKNVFVLHSARLDVTEDASPDVPASAPDKPRLVVDIFSGCGGLSLGFDILGGGKQFRTILAMDNQAAPIATLNRNAALLGHGDHPVGRLTDLTEFLNEAEVLAFYVDHAGRGLGDARLQTAFRALSNGAFPAFLDTIAGIDRLYLEELNTVRSTQVWRNAYDSLDKQALGQTSVIGFHDKLRLPRPSSKVAALPSILWGEPSEDTGSCRAKKTRPAAVFMDQATWEWDAEIEALSAKREADGKGQLTVSARRVSAFVEFLNNDGMTSMRDVWITWRARRLAARTALFEAEGFKTGLRALYEQHCKVSVLVGGPPCQGFSRIGRGKIRSLRDARVHVHGNAEAGDSRNLLFQQYVLVLGALRPDVFLFENVQHFQSVVKADGVEFQATEVLAEAIANMSDGAATYEVNSKILDASRLGIPQTRQRYFMAGVLAEKNPAVALKDANLCLDLCREREAPLALALAGLPIPSAVGGDLKSSEAMSHLASVDDLAASDHPFVRWIRQSQPGTEARPSTVDAHATRTPRADDAAFFALMGPGKRWMDYRADEAETVSALRELLDTLLAVPDSAHATLGSAVRKTGGTLPDRQTLEDLRGRVDGSLPLRLMLEQSGQKLGAPHHLLSGSYLEKRDGHHGDWVARMDSNRPAKTMVSHMGKDTYAFVHPSAARTISVREAARIQSFPDWFVLGDAALTDAYKMIGNAVPPMLSYSIASKVSHVLSRRERQVGRKKRNA